jgi:putative endonuclease
MATTQAQAAAAEDVAAHFLAERGLRLLDRNFRVRGGEIDLVCLEGQTTVFVEVRLRTRSDFGGAGASITAAKQKRLIVAARHWLARHHETPCRFDCVLMNGHDIIWLRDAFSAA